MQPAHFNEIATLSFFSRENRSLHASKSINLIIELRIFSLKKDRFNFFVRTEESATPPNVKAAGGKPPGPRVKGVLCGMDILSHVGDVNRKIYEIEEEQVKKKSLFVSVADETRRMQ